MPLTLLKGQARIPREGLNLSAEIPPQPMLAKGSLSTACAKAQRESHAFRELCLQSFLGAEVDSSQNRKGQM